MPPDGSRIACTIYGISPGLELYYPDHPQRLVTTGSVLGDLHRDLSVVWNAERSTNPGPLLFQECR